MITRLAARRVLSSKSLYSLHLAKPKYDRGLLAPSNDDYDDYNDARSEGISPKTVDPSIRPSNVFESSPNRGPRQRDTLVVKLRNA